MAKHLKIINVLIYVGVIGSPQYLDYGLDWTMDWTRDWTTDSQPFIATQTLIGAFSNFSYFANWTLLLAQ